MILFKLFRINTIPIPYRSNKIYIWAFTHILRINVIEETKIYYCLKCGYKFSKEEMEHDLPGIHCPSCGYKIISKSRLPYPVKKIKAI